MGFNLVPSSRTVPTIEQQAFLTELRRYIRDGFGAQINDIQDMRIDSRRITFRLASRDPNIVQIAARIREKVRNWRLDNKCATLSARSRST